MRKLTSMMWQIIPKDIMWQTIPKDMMWQITPKDMMWQTILKDMMWQTIPKDIWFGRNQDRNGNDEEIHILRAQLSQEKKFYFVKIRSS